MSNIWSKAKIAAGLTAFVMFVSIGNAGGEANATPGQYTRNGDVTVTLAVANGDCATAYFPRGGSNTFCGQYTFQQFNLHPGDKFGSNVVSYSGNSVFCKTVDNTTGDIIKMDYGYAGGSANCMSNAI